MELYERYLDCSEETKNVFEEIGIVSPFVYKYRQQWYDAEAIRTIEPIEDNNQECNVIFSDGYEMIVLGNFDEIYIRWNDLLNNEVE
jgi:hypothetical protein